MTRPDCSNSTRIDVLSVPVWVSTSWVSILGASVLGVWLISAVPVAGQVAPAFRRDVIVLDAAHGGSEAGAALAADVIEKDVTLAFAVRLRSLLAVRGFTVVMTRTGDAALTADQRAETANRARAVACVVIHATASGAGVHLAMSGLRPGERGSGAAGAGAGAGVDRVGVVAWDQAQAAYLDESERLADAVGGAVVRSHLPVVVDRAALRPLDNLSCPAVALELAPSAASGSDAAGADDDDYQAQVAKAIAGALVLWRNQARLPESVVVRPARTAAPVPASGSEPSAASRPAAGHPAGNHPAMSHSAASPANAAPPAGGPR